MKLSLKMNKLINLKGIDQFPALTYLKLSRNNIESIQEVSKLSALKYLKGISLYKNPLADDKQAYSAAVMSACPNLESLDHNACGDIKKKMDKDGLQDSKLSREKLDDKTEPAIETISVSNGFNFGAAPSTKWSKKQSSTGISKNTGVEGAEFQNQKIAMAKNFGGEEKFTGQRQTSLEKSSIDKREKENRETEYKFDEGMDEDDDDKDAASPPVEEEDDIFSMNPKSLATVKLAFERKVKERTTLLGSSSKKDEEIWLGSPTRPIGYFKRVGGNNYKVVGDGIWMLMAAKTVAIKSIDEVTPANKISFEYVLVDILKMKAVLSYFSQIKKLKSLKLVSNNIYEYLELVKFEVAGCKTDLRLAHKHQHREQPCIGALQILATVRRLPL